MNRLTARALVAALWLASLPAHAQSPAPSPAPAPAAPPAAPIAQFTLNEIGNRAEDVATQLRDMTAAIADQEAFSALEDRVLVFSHRIGDRSRVTNQMLGGSLRRGPLATLASSWRALRTELLQVRGEVDGRLERREADLTAIDRMKETWSWTLDHAKSNGAPAQVQERVQETIAAIDVTRTQIDARHSRLLVLQDAVSRAMEACDDAVARIANARKQAVSRAFATHDPPLWENLRPLATGADGSPHMRDDAGAGLAAVQIYMHAYRSGFALSGLVGLLIGSMLFRERDRVRRAMGSGAALPDFVAHALRSPIATALLLTLVLTRPLRPDPPAALIQVTVLIGLPAALIVLRPLLDARLLRLFYAFVAFFVVDLARLVLALPPRIEQWTLLAEMAVASAVMLRAAAVLVRPVGAGGARPHWMQGVGQRLLVAGGVATGFAWLAALLGYLELSDFVGGGALAIAYLAIGVLAFRVAAGSVIWLALVESPLRHLHIVDRNRARMDAGLSRALDVASVAIGFAFALQTFELLDPAVTWVLAILDAKLEAGELTISVGRVLGFFAMIGLAWLTSRIVTFALEQDVYPRLTLARGVPYALSTLIRYGLLLAGFFAALATLGLDLNRLTVLVSAFGLGLGFGMQQIVNNFVSGLILLFERPVQVGDQVQLKDLSGEVLRIGIRSSTIRTADGAEVIIPNSDLIQTGVTNWTLSDRRRRVTIDVGIAYGTPAERVIGLLLGVAKADPRVLATPATDALFTNFGDSGLEFQLRFWTEDPNWMQLKSDIGVRIQDALRDAAIGMPVTPVEVQIEGAGNGDTR